MKLIPYQLDNVRHHGGYSKTKNLKILEEFVESDLDCAKVEGWTNCDACHFANSLRSSIKRFNLSGIAAISRKDEVFLIKTNT